MFVEHTEVGEATSQERRDRAQPDSRVLGRVIQCDGARAVLAAFAYEGETSTTGLWSVGRMVSINLGGIRTVGLVYLIESAAAGWSEDGINPITVHVELVGEVRDMDGGTPVFDRGITTYPHIGAISHRIRARDLQAVYDLSGRRALTIGQLSQDATIEARIAIDDTLNRHFAVVGTTGVGKSTAVSLLLRKAIIARPDLRVLILDPHNEFSSAFPEQSIRVNTGTLDLPFWLFRLEELAEVLYRGREPVPEEIDLLRDLIPQAKQLYAAPQHGTIVRRTTSSGHGITADTPVPYRIADVIRMIDDRMGMLETKAERPFYRALRARIEAALHDPRYRFMFASRIIDDNIHETIGKVFRIPHNGRPITCFELAGLPSEVVNSVCSVLARLAFDLASHSGGRLKLLVMCEEAHRYMPADPKLGFAPTRHALSRIAKEGRKYGCFLGIVTQRPGELDPTVLSQCSTVFAMRLANESDQDIIRSAIADSSASSLTFLSSMGQREAIAFGEGVATTMRLKFEHQAPTLLPGARQQAQTQEPDSQDEEIDVVSLVANLRRSIVHTPLNADSSANLVRANALGAPVETTRQAGEPASEPTGDERQERLQRRRMDDDSFRRLYE